MDKANRSMRTNTIGNEAKIRILHTSQDAPSIDVYINGRRMVKDLPFKQVSSVLNLKAGKYHIDIYPTGNMIDSVLNKNVTVEAGKSYTLTTINHVKKMRLIEFLNQPEVPLNEAKVRFIHLSPLTHALDIAVKDRDVIFPNVSYKQSTDYLGLTPMTVDLELREAGSKNVSLAMPFVHFKANEAYTVALVGLIKDKPELQAVVFKD